jgi:hypothetical protein
MNYKSILRWIASWNRIVWMALLAFLTYFAHTAGFGCFGIGLILTTAVLWALAYAAMHNRFAKRVAIPVFTLVILWNMGWFTYNLITYGTVLVCPSGSARMTTGNYWGSWVVCRQPNGLAFGPAMGTVFTEGGDATIVYEDFRLVHGTVVGLRIECGHFGEFEVCFPEPGGSQRCEPAMFEPPLPLGGCINLSGRVSEAFKHQCWTRTSSSEPCY